MGDQMNKAYLVYRNGVLYTRTVTLKKAIRISGELTALGFKATFAEAI